MKRLFTLLLLSFAALSCEMGDEKLDDSSVTTIANNQIWYTSTDGKIVEPYSDWENNYADALTTFGVNIVSNTYVDGKGVIEFDGDVTIIGDYAFYYCSSLTSITIPDSVTEIGYEAFCSCDNLQKFNSKYASEDGRCLIIDGVLNYFAIGCGATEYTIPDSVTEIGYGAFYRCFSLTSVTIPDSVTSIGDRSFAWCRNLQEFKSKFASEDGRCLIIDGTLNAFAPAGLTEYTIPDSVTTIGECAFYRCYSLTSVTIPDSVTTIGNYAFFDCYSLTSVTIPDSVTTIGISAFGCCRSLTSVTIPDSVTTIGESAFQECYSLISVTIGDSVTTIGEAAFYWCHSLTSVYCKATTPPAGSWGMFEGNTSDRKIYVPMESVEAYKSAEGWSDYVDDIVGYNF